MRIPAVIPLVALMILLPICFALFNSDTDTFDIVKDTEEPVYINGTVYTVEFIESCFGDDYVIMTMNNGKTYEWYDGEYGDIKIYEGKTIECLCYIQGYDNFLRLYPCNDWKMGYIKEV